MPCPNATVGSILVRVATLLSDYSDSCQFVRFSKGFLVDALNEAACTLSALRPEAFSEYTKLELQPGLTQKLPPGYEAIVDIKRSSGAAVGKVDEYYVQALRGKKCSTSCCAADSYVMQSFTPHNYDSRTFNVYPEVPPGQNPVVEAILLKVAGCYCPSDEAKLFDVDCKWLTPIIEYMLYRALSTDIDSDASAMRAQNHLKAFYAGIDKQYLFEQRHGSGYYKGRVGGNDPNFQSR